MNPNSRLKHSSGRRIIASVAVAIAVVGSNFYSQSSLAQQNRQLVQKPAPEVAGAKRSALVIGNGAYTNAPPLKNPPNDARDMAATLKQLGFSVASAIDADQRTMKRLIREFGQQLKGGGQGLFYYAGHGVQMRGRNYLIPANADITSETDVEDQGVDLNLVLGLMDEAQNGLNIVILDACRNNPFTRSFRSAGSGLAQVDAPSGTLIAYATSPGRVAGDGQGRNGLYTSELLNQMLVTGISVEEMFKRVRAGVQKQTNGQQVPWESSSLVGNFYFATSNGSQAVASTNTGENRVVLDPGAFELSYWDTIKNSTNADDFEAYLTKYPDGQFAGLAKNRIKNLEVTAKPLEASRDTANNAATEVAFWDSVKNSSTADDFQAYLKKYPNGSFVDLANNRLRSLEAANKAKGRIFEVDWNDSGDRFANARLVILDNTFRFERDQQDIRNNAQAWAQMNNEDVETSLARLNRWYKDAWNCAAFKDSRADGAFITEITPTKTDLGTSGTYRLRFKSKAEAADALAGVRHVCNQPPTTAEDTKLLKEFPLKQAIAKAGSAKDQLEFNKLVIFQSSFALEPKDQHYFEGPVYCRFFKSAKVEGVQISEINEKGSAMYYRLFFETPADAAAALSEIQRICKEM